MNPYAKITLEEYDRYKAIQSKYIELKHQIRNEVSFIDQDTTEKRFVKINKTKLEALVSDLLSEDGYGYPKHAYSFEYVE